MKHNTYSGLSNSDESFSYSSIDGLDTKKCQVMDKWHVGKPINDIMNMVIVGGGI